MRLTTWVVLAFVLGAATSGAADAPSSPHEFFGFEPGSDRKLVDYGQLVAYLQLLDAVSPRLELREIGSSAMGRPLYAAFLSSAANLERLDELQAINRRLALDPEIPDDELDRLVEEGRVFVLATLSMHSTEVGPAQAFPLVAHELVTTEDPTIMGRLDEVVLMVIPTHNPDGMDMIVEHYRASLGTPYEGGSMPGVYHRYVGHDNNRDYVTLSQAESRAVNRVYSTSWFPQVHVDKHQMGRTGPRYFVPEVHDPIAVNVDEGLWYWGKVFGANLSKDMGADALQGVASHWLFDNYWPGPTETALWKGVISFLTEAASCRLATPVYVEPTELRVSGKGLSEYEKGVNLPDPWPGGWWKLEDIVRYELSSMWSILATAARHRADILRFRSQLSRTEVEKGRSEPPYYYVLSSSQHDRGALPSLVELLQEHGVDVHRLGERVDVDGRVFAAGDVVVTLAQPYRSFIKEVMEAQRYPVRHYTPDGKIIRPYDVTSWSLPLHRGVGAIELQRRSRELEDRLELVPIGTFAHTAAALPDGTRAIGFPAADNQAFKAAFAALDAGLQVLRLSAAVDGDDGADLPAGSIVIRGDREDLQRVADAVEVTPMPLSEAPAADVITIEPRRIALIETSFHDMDAGWTRFLFDGYGIRYQVLHPGDVQNTDIAGSFDVVVFPDARKDVLTKGRYKRGDRYLMNDLAPEYTRSITDEGMKKLVEFLDAGGIIVSWRRSTALFLDGLPTGDGEETATVDLPARDVAKSLVEDGLYVPGALLRARLITNHPLTWGMPEEIGVFSRGAPVFSTSIPILDMDRRVIATHRKREILLSGYIEGEKQLAGKPIMVWLRHGKGQLVLYGFSPQHRASTPATYKLLFNALLLPRIGGDG